MNALVADPMSPPPTMPPSLPEQPPRSLRFERSIDLAALPTAILCTRLFVASTLQRWGARFLEADAEMLAVELVRHSLQACGVTDEYARLSQLDQVSILRVRLLGFERSIGVEVWDNVAEPAKQPPHSEELQGLAVVDARVKNWGSCIAPPGRVTWAELDVYERTSVGLPIRMPRPYPRSSMGSGGHPSQNLELLRKVRNGLDRL
jgi:hypothetical protein